MPARAWIFCFTYSAMCLWWNSSSWGYIVLQPGHNDMPTREVEGLPSQKDFGSLTGKYVNTAYWKGLGCPHRHEVSSKPWQQVRNLGKTERVFAQKESGCRRHGRVCKDVWLDILGVRGEQVLTSEVVIKCEAHSLPGAVPNSHPYRRNSSHWHSCSRQRRAFRIGALSRPSTLFSLDKNLYLSQRLRILFDGSAVGTVHLTHLVEHTTLHGTLYYAAWLHKHSPRAPHTALAPENHKPACFCLAKYIRMEVLLLSSNTLTW